ncbi:MAG TPA: histidine kinase dimerization/phospho-acceptor domain-containing protein [Thermoanaerobaculia bacterium]|jgi:signal transduction histidine kinase|nr:histidine kinase dimerization/phospho-acceptor domain-containing protein [Thermoanaerobaculia bacterium]
MDAPENSLKTPQSGAPRNDLAGLLGPGVITLDPRGDVRFADTRALELLGCADGFELERLWERLKGRLEDAGLSWNGAGGGGQEQRAVLDLAVEEGATGGAPHRLLFDLRREPESGGVLLVHSLETLAGLESDLRLTSQMRSVSQISPAVAHDLRAPINAMVFNIEILKEMLASGRATDPANKDKLLRYVNVLKEELSRLHRGMENFLAYISPRGDRDETLDLRELAEELATLLVAPARKQQARVESELPAEPVPVDANRYLLRQALLHLALAALTGVPRQGALHVLLACQDGRARLRLYGVRGADSPVEADGAQPEPPAPGFDLSFSAGGALAQLWVARAILAAYGGEARAISPDGEGMTGVSRVYEVELTISENPSNGNKGVR